MKVILQQDLEELGSKDQIIEVSDGYARNFLIPRGLAIAATPSELKKWQERKKVEKIKSWFWK